MTFKEFLGQFEKEVEEFQMTEEQRAGEYLPEFEEGDKLVGVVDEETRKVLVLSDIYAGIAYRVRLSVAITGLPPVGMSISEAAMAPKKYEFYRDAFFRIARAQLGVVDAEDVGVRTGFALATIPPVPKVPQGLNLADLMGLDDGRPN